MKSNISRMIKVALAFAALFLLSSCGSSKPNLRPPEAPYLKGEVNFHLRGDNQLNVYQRIPHALIVCAYQLKDANAFHQTLEDKDGLAKLLECRRFDASVNYAKRLIVQPGQDVYEAMEKIEGTRMLGMVAGYYHFDKKKAVKIITLPMKGVLFRKPGGMDVALYLTGEEIRALTEDVP